MTARFSGRRLTTRLRGRRTTARSDERQTTARSDERQPTAPPNERQPGPTPPNERQPGATPPNERQPGATPPNERQPGATPPNERQPGATPPNDLQPGATPPNELQPDPTPPNELQSGATPPNERQPGPTPPNELQSGATRPNGRPSAAARLRSRSLRTRLLVLITAVLVCVCAAMALTTVFAQRAYLMGSLDNQVSDAAERGVGGAALHPQLTRDLTFLNESGHPAGMLAARFDAEGNILSAAVVTQDAPPAPLSDAQTAALRGLAPDGSTHTRQVPGLGTYRVTALNASGIRVLAGLPMDDVLNTISGLVEIEAVVAALGLTAAGCVCAVVIRRQLRPLGRVAATAVEVSHAPLGRGQVTGLTRVPDRDTDPGSEAGQVGAALNRMIDHVEASLAERQRSEEQMRRSEERMRRFLADASHELRTPLASIAGYAELMNRGTDRIEPGLAWRRVNAESARMRSLVEDLLLLARLDEGRPLQSAEVDMAALVAEAVWDARAAGAGHVWQLELKLDGGPALILGDEARLHQVVANLLANARVHTPAGTTVTATVEATSTVCVIRVRDDGPGIPPTLLPTVFERFTRADTSRTRTGVLEGGSGLGLAIVDAITTAHGGRIDVQSAPGRTEFTVELPITELPPTDTAVRVRPASV